MNMRLCHVFLVICLGTGLPATASEPLAVITAVSKQAHTVSLDTLKLIYQAKIQLDTDGQRWIPLNLPIVDPIRRSFSLELFAMLPEEQESYWNIQYFNGIQPPRVLASEEAVLRFVAATPGAIGYVRKLKADARVKILLVITPQAER